MGAGSVDTVIRRVGEEIHLHTHYTHREKARSVPGAKWNVDRRAWVYPLSKSVCVRLRDLFGAHAAFEGFDKPETPNRPTESSDVAVLQREVERLRRDLDVKTQQNAELHEKQTALIDRMNEAAQVFAEEKRFLEVEKKQLEAENRKLKYDLRESSQKAQNALEKPSEVLVKHAVNLSDSTSFAAVVHGSDFNSHGVRICSYLEKMLKVSLEAEDVDADGKRVELIELIRRAQENFGLDKSVVDVLHFIRTNRNALAHGVLSPQQQWLRNGMSVFAASYVWKRVEQLADPLAR